MRRFPDTFFVLPLAALLAGCAIPSRPQPPQLTSIAPLAGIAGQSGAVWPDSHWWMRYNDTQLDDLQARALTGSPTLAVAKARLQQATRAVDIARANAGARIQGSAQVQRERLSEHGLIPSEFLGFKWYSQGDLGAQFSYDFDFWGSHGADIAAGVDRARAAAAERDAAASMLAAAVADTYFGWQANQTRLMIAHQLVDIRRQVQSIAAARVRQGVDAPDTLQQADGLLADAREQAASIAGAARIQHAALAALLGVAPAQLPKLQSRPLPSASAALPADAGLDLVARRADVSASRWRVEAALRDIDVARAAFYPDLSLAAMAGLSSIDLGKLLSPASAIFATGPALHLPIFDSGRLRARFGVSRAQLAAAVADYNAGVVQAANQVATQALTLQQVQARRHERGAQVTAATELLASAQARAKRGLTDAQPVLTANANLVRQRDADAQLASAALSAEIALTQALGGGYRDLHLDSTPHSAGATPR